jgi:hypothetical protein
MLTRLRDQIGTAGLVVAVIALVAALGGGAYAASKGLNSTQKKEVKKIAKSFQGTGPAGAPGAAGPKGDTGAKGDAGAAGANGKDGTSPVGTSFSGKKGVCEDGGVEYKGSTTNLVCNGEEGPEGPEGSLWSAGGVLPEGATMTGTWGSFGIFSHQKEEAIAFPISFPVPLPAAAGAGDTVPPTQAAVDRVYVGPEEDKTAQGCPGYTNGIPAAEPGKLCVYADEFVGAQREGFFFSTPAFNSPTLGSVGGAYFEGVGTTGTIFSVLCDDECRAHGNWAVTAPEG